MRIRSIRPEFWTSTAISSLALEDRLLFIGLWSYVDDNGVGIDRLSLIATELFPDDIEQEPRETFARVSRGLANLSEAGRITRYSVDGKDYLSVTNWTEHQKIDKPGRARYPLPTSTDAHIRDTLANVSRDPIEASPTGEGEKGRRGEGEKENTCASTDVERARGIDDEFVEWYAQYPRKRGKGQAAKAYRAARKKASAAFLLDALVTQAPGLMSKGPEFAPYPATWLNGERWLDEIATPTDQAADDEWGPRKPDVFSIYDGDEESYLLHLERGGWTRDEGRWTE